MKDDLVAQAKQLQREIAAGPPRETCKTFEHGVFRDINKDDKKALGIKDIELRPEIPARYVVPLPHRPGWSIEFGD